ncbi:NAD-dependent epimerase/dehydratase family protein [Flavobacterium qiangtangense]|uniref:NAD-dependent epimerase/dehydratase family protein n=1 Tax=Flavobacterium qiangtangense TaxID=1442595 RepID=A0ABW1PTE8_9FLAO
MKNCVAVIGANGFLGSALVSSLIEKGDKVFAVHNGNTANISSKSVLLTNELFLLSDIIPDTIYFAVGNYACSHSQLLEINELLYSILKKFPNSKVVYISSTNVYGMHKETISLESHFNNPGLYAISKIAGEFIVSNHKRHAILRLTYLYGHGINNNSFLPNIIASSKEKGLITLFGDGMRAQDYLHIDDAVSLCIMSSNLSQNEILIGASGVSTTNKEVASIIRGINKCEVKYTGIETGESYHFNIENTTKKLGWKPRVSFEKGLTNILAQ